MGSSIICPWVDNSIFSWFYLSCIEVHSNIEVRIYGSFRSPLCSMNGISFSLCLTSMHEAWSCLRDIRLMLSFRTLQITTLKVVFGTSGRLLLPILAVHSSKSVTGWLLPCVPFWVVFWTLQCFKNRLINLCSNQLSLTRTFHWMPVLEWWKIPATTISPGMGPCRSCF